MNKDNLSKYANLPKKIIERFKQGKMSFAHFSDTLRFELLREHGGVWIDATCFVSSEIPYYVFEHSFYSLNGAYAKDLGFGVEIGNHSTLSSLNLIIIEDYVLTGPHVFISDHNHKYADPSLPISQQGVSCKKDDRIVIGEGSWLGTNVVIIGNVRIGKHCVIGANSVVTKDIPDYCVAVGMPAKIIKKYNSNTKKWEKV